MHEYAEHSAGGGAGARAVAQVERDVVGGGRAYGVGVHASIVRASLLAVVSTVNRAFPRPGGLARVLHAARSESPVLSPARVSYQEKLAGLDQESCRAMAQEIRFGELTREGSLEHQAVSYNELTPKRVVDVDGREIPHRPERIHVRSIDLFRLLAPYVGVRFIDQARTVVPLALYLALFQLLLLHQAVSEATLITAGFVAVILGLMLFMEGLKLGLMPFSEVIGHSLPKKLTLPFVLAIAFLLGIGVTFAEPAIGALRVVGASVDVEKAPYLYAMLNDWSGVLVLVIGMGVGLAAVMGTLRFLEGWSLKPMIYLTLVPTLGLTVFVMLDPQMSQILGLAWDSGAVTTGPVTVPLVLSLGIGIASSASKGASSLSGFGIVALASLFPIIAVLLLGILISQSSTPEEIITGARSAEAALVGATWYTRTPVAEIIDGLRAIVPLVAFLFLILIFILREKLQDARIVAYGLVLTVLGLIVFNLGLSYGLAELGAQAGGLVPAAFSRVAAVNNSPLYVYSLGITVALVFALVLGFGATLAEPALNALGFTVENLTNGAFKKRTLLYTVAAGVGVGMALGVLKIIFEIPTAYLILPGYGVAAVLTALSSEEFVNVAWDSAGVTTGPITVPLVLAMGLGFGNAVGAVDGFGILSMASIGPIVSVLATGLWVQVAARRRARREEVESEEAVAAA